MNIINRYTLQTLKKNKMRTWVTIIGIILSTAMFTGVTSIIFSFQQYVLDLELKEFGSWEGRVNRLSKEEVQKFQDSRDVKDSTVVGNVGYTKLEGVLNESKPYLCVVSIGKNYNSLGKLHLREGRMPKTDNEIVIPAHLEENGGISYKVGDTLTADFGKRTVDEEYAGQEVEYCGKDSEKLVGMQQRTYKIVGICERPAYEGYSAAGYTAFTTGETDTYLNDIYFTSKNPKQIDEQITDFYVDALNVKKSEIIVDRDYSLHNDLLRITGASSGQTYRKILLPMAGFLIAIIMIASVTLIYNAFSISISERTKQFGLLKSIGATKKQIRHGVYFEALSLCLIGIPLGVGGGLVGIAITLHFVADLIRDFINAPEGVVLRLHVYPLAIVIAVVVAVITVLISAMIPARRAVKMTAIDALRESRDIRIRSRKIRSSRFIYLFFGFEGMLANKNFKRNRKKYRMTVFSLVVSIVLFVGTSAFNLSMSTSIGMFEKEETADITLPIGDKEMGDVDEDTARERLGKLQYIDDAAYSRSVEFAYLLLDKEELDKEYYEANTAKGNNGKNNPYFENFQTKNNGDKVLVPADVQFVDDASYEKYLRDNHLDVSKYMDTENLCPLIWDRIMAYVNGSKLTEYHIMRKDTLPKKLYCVNRIKGYEYFEDFAAIDLKSMEFPFMETDDESTDVIQLPAKQALTEISLGGGLVTDYAPPLAINSVNRWFGSVTMVLPYSAKGSLSGAVGMEKETEFNFKAKEYRKATTNLSTYLQNESSFGQSSAKDIYCIREEGEAQRALMLVINIFTYGFIILITLIVIANVFNTISTNILLRRKEFAMLKSVGMTRAGSQRMMNFECLLYGVKGLVIGLPLALLVCYFLSSQLHAAIEGGILIPWGSVITVVVGVFVVVFASMLYSMQKIRKDNPIDALKSDVI